jgi:hypothetical protein
MVAEGEIRWDFHSATRLRKIEGLGMRAKRYLSDRSWSASAFLQILRSETPIWTTATARKHQLDR